MNTQSYIQNTKMTAQNRTSITTAKKHTHKLAKYLVPALLLTALAVSSNNAQAAGSCGIGKVLEVKEGGWNTNDLMIKIDYTGGAAVGTNYQGYIRFQATLNADRLKGLRAVAYLAMATNKRVSAYSHDAGADACTKATELTILQ